MNPQIFGWQHLTYLAVFIVLMVASLILIKIYAKSEKAKFIIVKVVAALLLIFIVWNRIAIAVSHNNWHLLIPDSFCGMSSLVLSLACLIGKKNNNVLHFVFYVAIVGGFLTMIYPDFIDQNPSFFYSNTISGFLHHSFALYLCVLLLVVGYFTPNYKKWGNLVIGFMAYITLGTFLISVFDYSDAFYINNPILSGTPLTVWLIAVIFAVIYVLLFVVYELIKRKLASKKAENGGIKNANKQAVAEIDNKNTETKVNNENK